MKKNKMMRLASGLLVAVLITTSTISGTFAKYVTEDSATDSARVAKFGVTVTAEGSLFGETYINAEGGNTPADSGELTVVATENVVAPGTKNGAEPIEITVTGTPEVDVRVTLLYTAMEGYDDDVYLGAGKYADMTTGDTTDYFETAKYEPVKYTLKKDGAAVTGATNVNLATLKTALSTAFTQTYPAGTNLADEFGVYTIEWAWAYGDPEGSAITANDKADTYLGDLAAGTVTAESYTGEETGVTAVATDYNLKTGLNFTIRVEQID